MMLHSFIKNTTGNIVVITSDQINDKVLSNRINYINMNSMIKNRLKLSDIKKTYRIPLFCWLKNQTNYYISHFMNSEIVVCLDGDILFYQDINNFIKNSIDQYPNYFFIQSDAKDSVAEHHCLVNSGFWFCDKNLFPLYNMMNDLNARLEDLYYRIENPGRLLLKYTDQIILRELLVMPQYNNYKILSKKLITTKYKNTESILCHYFTKKLHLMTEDYKKFII